MEVGNSIQLQITKELYFLKCSINETSDISEGKVTKSLELRDAFRENDQLRNKNTIFILLF